MCLRQVLTDWLVPILWVFLPLREKPQAGSLCAFFIHRLSIHILFRYSCHLYCLHCIQQQTGRAQPLTTALQGLWQAASEVCGCCNGPRIGDPSSVPFLPILYVLFVQSSSLFAPFSIALGLLLFLLCMCLRSLEGCTISLSPADRFQGWEVSCHHLPPP